MQETKKTFPIIPAALIGLAFLAIGLAGCAAEAEHGHDLTLSGTGFTSHVGETVTVSVVHADDGDLADAHEGTVAADGTFSIVVVGALHEGESYIVHYYSDVDASGDCDAGDALWSYDLADVAGDEVIAVTYAAPAAGGDCTPHTLTPAGH